MSRTAAATISRNSKPAQATEPAGTIASMVPGDAGFTAPWAMRRDMDGAWWMMGKFRVYADPNPADQSTMRVEYRGGGFHVWPPEGQAYPKSQMPARCNKIPVGNRHDAPAHSRTSSR